MSTTLVASSAIASLIAGVYAYVGVRLADRPVSSVSRTASMAFTTWWLSVALATLLGALASLAGAAGLTDLGLHIALTYATFLFICVGLWGLLYYLVYLYTGNRTWMGYLAAAYVAYYLVLVGYIAYLEPKSVIVGTWTVQLSFTIPPTGPVATTLAALLVLPQSIAALLYLSLLTKVEDTTRRYRIVLVGSAILIWFASSLAASATGGSESALWPMISRAIGLSAALTILAAYFPPSWVQQRWGIDPLRPSGDNP